MPVDSPTLAKCVRCGYLYDMISIHTCLPKDTDDGQLRTFATGATRDTAEDKLDFEGFLSPEVLLAFAEYMHENRIQSDGSLRDSDNWQKGIPLNQYMKSAWRHFFDWWQSHRNGDIDMEALHGLLFNVMGYLHEVHYGKSP